MSLEESAAKEPGLVLRYWFWFAPIVLLLLALDNRWGGPYFAEKTGAGRFERNPDALLLFALTAACAFWLSSSRRHSRWQRVAFKLFCFGAFALDQWYATSTFGWSMFVLAMSTIDLHGIAPAKRKSRQTS
jgi:hypothetical protein